jgi:hypothetical protein
MPFQPCWKYAALSKLWRAGWLLHWSTH